MEYRSRISLYKMYFCNSLNLGDVPHVNNVIKCGTHSLNSSFYNINTSLPLLIQKVENEEDHMRFKDIELDLMHIIPIKKHMLCKNKI